MYEIIPLIIPNPVRPELQRVTVSRLSVMRRGVSSLVSSASDVAADQAYPEGVRRGALLAAPFALRGLGLLGTLHATADRTCRIGPLFEAVGVERVVAEDREDAVDRFVHSFCKVAVLFCEEVEKR